jgi:hypothetical protein
MIQFFKAFTFSMHVKHLVKSKPWMQLPFQSLFIKLLPLETTKCTLLDGFDQLRELTLDYLLMSDAPFVHVYLPALTHLTIFSRNNMEIIHFMCPKLTHVTLDGSALPFFPLGIPIHQKSIEVIDIAGCLKMILPSLGNPFWDSGACSLRVLRIATCQSLPHWGTMSNLFPNLLCLSIKNVEGTFDDLTGLPRIMPLLECLHIGWAFWFCRNLIDFPVFPKLTHLDLGMKKLEYIVGLPDNYSSLKTSNFRSACED